MLVGHLEFGRRRITLKGSESDSGLWVSRRTRYNLEKKDQRKIKENGKQSLLFSPEPAGNQAGLCVQVLSLVGSMCGLALGIKCSAINLHFQFFCHLT